MRKITSLQSGFFLLILLSCGCTTSPTSPPIESVQKVSSTLTSTQAYTATPTNTAIPSPLPAITLSPTPLPLTHYMLLATYDAAAQSAQVEETLRYVNTTNTTLQELPLVVEANIRDGVFKLIGLQWQNGDTIKNYILDGNLLILPLQAPLASGEILEFHLQYTLQLPNQSGTLGYDARQANFGEWYPFIPVFLPPDGWQIFPHTSVGENLVYDSAGFDVEIRPKNAPHGMLIAASAEADQVGNIFRYHRSVARNFAWSASNQYQIVEDVNGEKMVRGYVFAEHEEAGITAAHFVREALGVFGDRYSPYQPDTLTFVEASFDDGMEYDGLFFLNDKYFAYPGKGPEGGLAALSTHETAHQWWFARVGNIQPTQPWLDEALCTYSEVLYYEALYPGLVDWWWEYRVDSYEPKGFVNSTIYDLPSYRTYVNAVYLRGAYFLRDLRSQLGDEAFFKLLHTYDSIYAGKVARAEDFFSLINNDDLTMLLEEYFKP